MTGMILAAVNQRFLAASENAASRYCLACAAMWMRWLGLDMEHVLTLTDKKAGE